MKVIDKSFEAFWIPSGSETTPAAQLGSVISAAIPVARPTAPEPWPMKKNPAPPIMTSRATIAPAGISHLGIPPPPVVLLPVVLGLSRTCVARTLGITRVRATS